MVETLNEYSEADWVVGEIERAVGGTDFARVDSGMHSDAPRGFRDFAVIYRTHGQSRALRRRFDDSGLPYQVVGGGSVYEQPQMQNVVAVLRLLAGLDDPRSQRPAEEVTLVAGEMAAQLGTISVAELAERIGGRLGADGPVTSRFAGLVLRFGTDVAACVRYLDELAAAEYYDPAAEAVTLTTIHAAKGLEFDYVMICGCEEGVLPHARSSGDDEGVAEEQRLFYVAVTRAKEHLDLLWARERGGRSAKRSRFIESLPVTMTTDPAVPALLRKRAKKTRDRAQGKLF